LVAYLLSDRAAFITGSVHSIDGGYTAQWLNWIELNSMQYAYKKINMDKLMRRSYRHAALICQLFWRYT
jgi:hypothetical protein